MVWLLWACGLKELLPEGPVLTPAERAAFVLARSGATYISDPRVDFPVLPVVVWGVAYDLDLVVVSRHPDWDMHEIARLQTPEGPLWIAKDARAATLAQTVVVDVDDVYAWFPELPVERKAGPVEVVDRSTADMLDLDVRYHNVDGEPVEITYRGRPPTSAQRKRNGNTMGHSRDAVLAVLDLPYRDFGRSASVRIDDEDVGVERILGLVPFRMALVQTQGGLATGHLRQIPRVDVAVGELTAASTAEAFDTVHEVAPGHAVRLSWTLHPGVDEVEARQELDMRTLVYRFRRGAAGALELVEARVDQAGREVPVTRVVFSPALPDLARRFEGRVQSRFAVDIDGQPGHAVGRVEAWWGAEGPVVDVLPEAPPWTTDRPLHAQLVFDSGGVATQITVARDEP